MKITAFVGSGRKGHTLKAVEDFITNLKNLRDIDSEIVKLSDYDIKPCIGCLACFEKGEEYCPHKDDLNVLLKKIEASDGVIFASPNYSFNVSGLMKVFFDRIAYIFHRPQFFGKLYTNIVTEGIYDGRKIVNYLNFLDLLLVSSQ